MTGYLKKIMWLVFAAIIAGGLFTPSFTYAQSGSGTEINNDNLYLFAEQITLDVAAPKDVLVFAGDVVINAPIQGDLQIAAQSVHINAPVSGDLRVAAADIYIKDAHVGEDMVLTGGNITVENTATSSGHTMIFAANTIFNGNSEKSLTIKGSDVTLGGVQSGDVDVEAAVLKVEDNFKAKKDFSYATNSEITLKDTAVDGKVQKNISQGSEITTMDRIGNALSVFFSLFIALVLLTWFFPALVLRQMEIMKTETLLSFVKGFLGGILFPILFLLLVFTIIGFPLILGLFFLYLAVLCISPLLASMYLGTLLLTRNTNERRYILLIALVGSLIATLILQIPVIGGFVMILLSATGVGSFMKRRERAQ